MDRLVLLEEFDGPKYSECLNWSHLPLRHTVDSTRSALIVETRSKTDFWQKTHYGFEADNGHFLHTLVDGDFTLSTKVRFFPVHQYDQAGLMVYITSECWLKASVEYEPDGPCRLGAVVTNKGYSDWSTQEFARDRNEVSLRVRREGCDYIVEYETAGGFGSGSWSQMRMARLHDDRIGLSVRCGLYACSPKGEGFRAEFDLLKIERSSGSCP